MPLMYPEWGDIWKGSSFESIPAIKHSDVWESMFFLHKETSRLQGTEEDKLRIFKIFALTKGLSENLGLNLLDECMKKMEVNWGRPYRYGTVDEGLKKG